MNDPRDAASRPLGQTSGTQQRPPHAPGASIIALELPAEADALRREPAWLQGDRNAKTFSKEPDLRVVLTTLKQGAVVREHRVPGSASVQTLSGRIRLRLEDEELDIAPGDLVILGPDAPHDVEALEDSAFLLTVAWRGQVRGDASRL